MIAAVARGPSGALLATLKMQAYRAEDHPEARFRVRRTHLAGRGRLVYGLPLELGESQLRARVEQARARDVPIYFLIGENNFDGLSQFMQQEFGTQGLRIIPETHDAPIDPRAGELELTGYIPPFAPNRLVVIGALHDDLDGRPAEAFDRMYLHLRQRARRGEILFGVEGDTFDPSQIENIRRSGQRPPASGYECGIENAIPFLYSFALVAYWNYFDDNHGYDILHQAQIVAGVANGKIDGATWRSSAARDLTPDARRLMQLIDDRARRWIGRPLDGSQGTEWIDAARDLASRETWRVLIKELVLATEVALRNLEAGARPDVETVRYYLEHPDARGAWSYIFDEVNIRWRDTFILRNIQTLVAVAQPKALPVYVLIGREHLVDLVQRLGPEHGGYQVVPFRGLDELPAEYFPGFGPLRGAPAAKPAGQATALANWVVAAGIGLAALLCVVAFVLWFRRRTRRRPIAARGRGRLHNHETHEAAGSRSGETIPDSDRSS